MGSKYDLYSGFLFSTAKKIPTPTHIILILQNNATHRQQGENYSVSQSDEIQPHPPYRAPSAKSGRAGSSIPH